MSTYCPNRGDVVWLDYDPQLGHEQASKRPAMVLSPVEYNKKVGLALFVPITSQIKGYPFEVRMALSKINGVILADQIKSLDWKARRIKFIETAPKALFEEAKEKLKCLID
ncbi:MAG: endoribonuclease MazF [Nitrospirota bacterium]